MKFRLKVVCVFVVGFMVSCGAVDEQSPAENGLGVTGETGGSGVSAGMSGLGWLAQTGGLGADGSSGTFDESACTVFVDEATGSESANGRAKNEPLKSIDKATDIVQPGDTVCVYPGNYSAFQNRTDGTKNARIHFVSVKRWEAKVSSGTDTPIDNKGEYVDIDGFEVTATSASIRIGIQNGDGYFASHSRIFNNHVYGIGVRASRGVGGAGIDSAGWRSDAPYQGTDVEIFNNLVHDIGNRATNPGHFHGIYVSHPYAKIYNNIVYNTGAWGIHGWHNANYVVVSNNLTSNTYGIVMGNGNSPCDIITCEFRDYYVTNNILYNDRIGIKLYSGGPNHFISNNNFYNTPSSGKNASTDNPKLENYALDGNGDFHLRAESPVINAGLATYAPSFDFDYRARPQPQDSAYDVGPYEF
jgi:hypothetical protein